MKGYCDVCGALDTLETRRLPGASVDLCAACRRITDANNDDPWV